MPKKEIVALKKREYRYTVAKITDFGCVFSERETPVPIPNTEVKPFCGNGTALLSVGE